jgi:hypothetical protein
MKRRHNNQLLLYAVLTLLLAMPAGAREPDADSDATTAPREKLDGVRLEQLKREPIKVEKSDSFRSKAWYVPKPPPPPPPPPPPTAPPLPFSFLGRIQDDSGTTTLFLSDNVQVHLVHTGDKINNTYSVDGIEDGKLVLTYLPLNIKQYLSVGDPP